MHPTALKGFRRVKLFFPSTAAMTACADGLRFRVQEALQIWYGPDAANLRLIQDELHLGEEGPRGSGEDLRLFWNVAVSNIIPPSQFRNLRIRTAPDKIVVVPLVPGGLMLSRTLNF